MSRASAVKRARAEMCMRLSRAHQLKLEVSGCRFVVLFIISDLLQVGYNLCTLRAAWCLCRQHALDCHVELHQFGSRLLQNPALVRQFRRIDCHSHDVEFVLEELSRLRGLLFKLQSSTDIVCGPPGLPSLHTMSWKGKGGGKANGGWGGAYNEYWRPRPYYNNNNNSGGQRNPLVQMAGENGETINGLQAFNQLSHIGSLINGLPAQASSQPAAVPPPLPQQFGGTWRHTAPPQAQPLQPPLSADGSWQQLAAKTGPHTGKLSDVLGDVLSDTKNKEVLKSLLQATLTDPGTSETVQDSALEKSKRFTDMEARLKTLEVDVSQQRADISEVKKTQDAQSGTLHEILTAVKAGVGAPRPPPPLGAGGAAEEDEAGPVANISKWQHAAFCAKAGISATRPAATFPAHLETPPQTVPWLDWVKAVRACKTLPQWRTKARALGINEEEVAASQTSMDVVMLIWETHEGEIVAATDGA
eukprot:TRINITY_DN14451_c0_g1_i1.p2 TRINITY_DN14451_c0_g1~~TRINITY_DN14451_c0_g1_i1.p2  ORF type:complete len:474 (+),score=61.62 TRINITY_DN14451_c0_g1_i1:3589-5010(+)